MMTIDNDADLPFGAGKVGEKNWNEQGLDDPEMEEIDPDDELDETILDDPDESDELDDLDEENDPDLVNPRMPSSRDSI